MFALIATLGALSKTHACVPDPKCLACEQSFEACVPDPIFDNDEETRFEYADGMCSCDKDTCEAQEQQYSFVDPVTKIPVVVYRLKCCNNAMKCTSSSTSTTTSSSSSISPITTMTSTMSTTESPKNIGSGDGSGSGDDANALYLKSYQSSTKSGASYITHAFAIVMLPALCILLW